MNPIIAIRQDSKTRTTASDIYVLFEIFKERNPDETTLIAYHRYTNSVARFIEVKRADWDETGVEDRLGWLQERIEEINLET